MAHASGRVARRDFWNNIMISADGNCQLHIDIHDDEQTNSEKVSYVKK
jgi:hypothetical protein